MMETLVDPHPANNTPSGPTPQYSQYQPSQARWNSNPDQEFYLEQAANDAAAFTDQFQSVAVDPNVVIPANVQAAADYYQHTQVAQLVGFPINSQEETLLNLWGESPNAIENDSAVNLSLTTYNETGPGIGHGEMMFYPKGSNGYGKGVYEQIVLTNQTLQALGLKPFVADPLVVTTQPPANVTAGTPFGMVVTAENANGTVNTSFNGSVSLNVYGGLYGGTLGGITSVNAVNGVATFSGLTITEAGNYLQIYASATGEPGVYTNSFNVTAAAASQLAVQLPDSYTAFTALAGTRSKSASMPRIPTATWSRPSVEVCP